MNSPFKNVLDWHSRLLTVLFSIQRLLNRTKEEAIEGWLDVKKVAFLEQL